MTTRIERIYQACHQGSLGAHDGEVDALALHRRDDSVDVIGSDVEQPRIPRDAGVAGRAQQLVLPSRALQRKHDRVLAPASADDQDLHARAIT